MAGSTHVRAQMTSPVPQTPAASITITRFQDHRDRYPDLLDTSGSRYQLANSFILSNTDSRDVVAVYAIWKIVDSNGRTYVHGYMRDIYISLLPNAVLQSGSEIVLSPGGWILSPASSTQAILQSATDPSAVFEDTLATAMSVSVSIDAVIFADGEICGNNTIGLDRAITSRKKAAQSLSPQMRGYISRGEDWRPKAHGKLSASSDISSEEYWQSIQASQLGSMPDDKAAVVYLNYLDKLPQPPQFYIKDKSGMAKSE